MFFEHVEVCLFVFVIYLYPRTEIDVKSFKYVSWLTTFL